MDWDSFKGFETTHSKELARQIAEAEQILAQGTASPFWQSGDPMEGGAGAGWKFDEMGLGREIFNWSGADPISGTGGQIAGAATHTPTYEGQMFGHFAKAAGLTPEQAEQKFNQYISQAGQIENLGLRTKIPIDSLIGEYGSALPSEAKEWWNTTGRNEAESQAQSWQDMRMAQNKANGWRKAIGPLSLMAPMAIGPLSVALGLTTAPATATMMPAFADAGTAGLGVGAGASATSFGNLVTGLVKNPATSRFASEIFGDSGGESIQRSAQIAPQATPTNTLSESVLSQTTNAPSISAPQSLSNSVMTTSTPQNVVRRPQIRLSPGFRRGQ